MSEGYCTVGFSWNLDRSMMKDFLSYSFIDYGSNITDESEFPNESFESYSTSTTLSIPSGCDIDCKHCLLEIFSAKPDFVLINGISIISDSRTLEISNDVSGYITTVKGKKISSEGSEDVYLCQCKLDDKYSSISVKFLSLGNRTSFHLYTLKVNIQQSLDSSNGSTFTGKLRRNIEEMGDSVSNRALDFLNTITQYEQNKLQNSDMFMKAFMSNGENLHKIDQDCSLTLENGLSSVMNSFLDVKNFKNLCEKHPTSENLDKPDIFHSLQSMFKKVNKLRAEEIISTCDQSENVEQQIKTIQEIKDDGILLSLVEGKINQVQAEMTQQINEIKKEVDLRLEQMDAKINLKLDCIIKLLQKREENILPQS